MSECKHGVVDADCSACETTRDAPCPLCGTRNHKTINVGGVDVIACPVVPVNEVHAVTIPRQRHEIMLRFATKAELTAFLGFRQWWRRELIKRANSGLSNDDKGLHGPRALVMAEVIEP